MKISIVRTFFLATVLTISALFNSARAQRDTLHIFYQGLQTTILDSNDAKITKWVKGLNGRKVELQIFGYYEDAQYKKYMAERVDNLFLVVNRKARDLINVTFMGPVKGKKSQRSTADIVYSFAATPAAASTTNKEPEEEKKPKAEKPAEMKQTAAEQHAASQPEKPRKEEKKKMTEVEKTAEPVATEAPANEVKPVVINNQEYIIDSIYVNGQLKVTKRKVKKKK